MFENANDNTFRWYFPEFERLKVAMQLYLLSLVEDATEVITHM